MIRSARCRTALSVSVYTAMIFLGVLGGAHAGRPAVVPASDDDAAAVERFIEGLDLPDAQAIAAASTLPPDADVPAPLPIAGGGETARRRMDTIAEACLAAEHADGWQGAARRLTALLTASPAPPRWEAEFVGRLRDDLQARAGLAPDAMLEVLGAEEMERRAGELRAQGRLSESLGCERAAVRAYAGRVGPDDLRLAGCIGRIAELEFLSGSLQAAERHCRAAWRLRSGALGPHHPLVAEDVHNLSVILQELERLDEAEALARASLSVRERLYDDLGEDAAANLNVLAVILDRRGRFEEAIGAYRRLEGVHRARGQLADLGLVLNNMATALVQVGRLREAETALREAIHIGHNPEAVDAFDTAGVRSALGQVLAMQGRYDEAEAFMLEALAMHERDAGPYRVALDHLELSGLYHRCGQLDRAAQRAMHAAEMLESLGADVPPGELARCLHNWGTIELDRANRILAKDLLDRSREIWERLGPAGRVQRSASLAYLGMQLVDDGRPGEAEAVLREVVHLELELYGPESADHARALGNLGLALQARGAHEEARRCYAQSKDLFERQLGPDHPDTAWAYANLAALDYEQGRLPEAERGLGAAAAVLEALRTGPAPGLLGRPGLANALGLSTAHRYLALVRVLRGDAAGALDAAERGRARYYLDLISSAKPGVRAGAAKPEAGAGIVPLAKLRESLRSGDRLLSYVWTKTDVAVLVVPPSGTGEVAAFIVARGAPNVDRLAGAIERQKAWLAAPGAPAPGGADRDELQRLVPRELALRCWASAHRLVIVPDGPVHGLPFESLPVPSDRSGEGTGPSCWAESASMFVYAPSASVYVDRLCVRERDRRPSETSAHPWSALLVGAVEGVPESVDSLPGGPTVGSGELPSPQTEQSGGTTAGMPGASRELGAVAALVRSVGGQAEVLPESLATLPAVRGRAAGRRFIVFATHGLSAAAGTPLQARLMLASSDPSGGAGFLTLEDLILDWQGLLDGCELVVLSACESERGVQVGDSVLALPMGFFYAGAPSVIATPWKVNDAAAALLVHRLFENLLGAFAEPRHAGAVVLEGGVPVPKLLAMREAQLWLRGLPTSEARERLRSMDLTADRGEPVPRRGVDLADTRPFSHPSYWSAFVLVGAPE